MLSKTSPIPNSTAIPVSVGKVRLYQSEASVLDAFGKLSKPHTSYLQLSRPEFKRLFATPQISQGANTEVNACKRIGNLQFYNIEAIITSNTGIRLSISGDPNRLSIAHSRI